MSTSGTNSAASRIRALAAAQTIAVRGNVQKNVEQHLRLVRLAADQHSEILVFPELSLTGYELDLADELAFSENDPRLAPLVDAARLHAMTLVVGAPVRIGDNLHIGAFIVSPDGSLTIHTKQHLGAFSRDVSPDGIVPPAEDTVFRPGDRHPLFPISGGTAALGVCAESLRRSHPRCAAEGGANTYLTCHFGTPLDVDLRATALQGHAVRHSMAVVFANHGGPTGGLAAGGKSAIWSEEGELLAQLEEHGAGVVTALDSPSGWHGGATTSALA